MSMGQMFNDEDRRKHRLFNGPQLDPTQPAAEAAVPYYARRNKTGALMPDDFMPVGEHARKHLRAVPVDYLRWVNAQPWSLTWRHWQPVADYLERFPLPEKAVAEGAARVDVVDSGCSESGKPSSSVPPPPPVIFVDVLTPCVPTKAWRWPSSCHLHCLPGHEDRLHAFALGALGLQRAWFQRQPGSVPHYDLNEAKQEQALGCGAELIDRRQMGEHLRRWREHGGVRELFMRVRDDGTRTCTKHCYGSEKEAQTVINERVAGRVWRQGRRYRHNTPDFLRSYLCPICGFHHITSKP